MQMTPVYWLIFGIGLLILEVMTPALISLFFGLSALTVALIVWLFPVSQVVQWLLFAVFSVGYILLLRKAIKQVFKGDKEVSDRVSDEFAGRRAVVVEPVAPNKPGRVELNGCTWMAEAEAALSKGQSVRVLKKDNLTLKVEAV